jgi:hypothetical protein
MQYRRQVRRPPPVSSSHSLSRAHRCNRYVSILSERSADGIIWAPDSRVCVWFVDTEAFNFYDVGAGLCAIAQFWDAVDARLLAVHCLRLPGEAVAAAADGSDEAEYSHQQCTTMRAST